MGRMALRLSLASVFLLSFSYKLAEPETLPGLLAKLPSVPEMSLAMRRILSWLIIGLEGCIGIAILLGQHLRLAFGLGALLPLAFSLMVAPFFAQVGGDCACFWRWMPLSPESGLQLIVRNVFLASVSLFAYQIHVGKVSFRQEDRPLVNDADRASNRRTTRLQWCALALAAFLAIGLLLLFTESVQEGTGGVGTIQVAKSEAEGLTVALDRDLLIRRVEGAQRHPVTDDDTGRNRLSGSQLRVVDEYGTPLPDAEIRALDDVVTYRMSDYTSVPDAPCDPLCVTDSEGYARLSNVRRPRRLVASRAGYQPALFSVGAQPTDSVEVVLNHLHGNGILVQNPMGGSIADARILIEVSDWGWPVRRGGSYFDLGRTDSAGRLPVSPRSPRCRALIAAEGYCLAPFNIGEVVSARGDVTYVLPSASSVAGTVTGAHSDRPLYVVAERVSDPEQPMMAAAVASGQRFVHPALIDGVDWALTPCVMSDEGPQAVGPPVTVRPPVTEVLLSTAAGLSLTLRALDASGDPVSGSVVLSLLSNEFLARPDRGLVSVDPDGANHWRSLPCPGPSTAGSVERELWVCADGFLSKSVGLHELRPGGHVDLGDVLLTAADEWKVRVVSAVGGDPIEGARVRFVPNSVLDAGAENSPWLQTRATDVAGRVRLNAPDGEGGVLDVLADGWMPKRVEIFNVSWIDYEVRLERPAGILLACESIEGELVSGACIQWRTTSALTASDRGWNEEYTGADGYALFEVPPGGVEVRHAPGVLRGRTRAGFEMAVDLQGDGQGQPQPGVPVQIDGLEPGEVRAVTLKLNVISALNVLVLVDGRRSPGDLVVGIPGSKLDVVLNDLWGTFDLPRDVTDQAGECSLRGLPLGVLTLARIDPATRITSFMVIRADRPVNVPVTFSIDTREISAVVVDSDDVPIAGVPVRLEQLTIQHGIRSPSLVRLTPSGAHRPQGDVSRVLEAVTDQHGRAVFPGIPHEARFKLLCAAPDAHPLIGSVRVDVGHSDTEIVLRDGSGAAIEVRDRGGSRQPGLPVLLRWTDRFGRGHRLVGRSNSDGVVRFSSLDPGSYLLLVESGDSARIELAAGGWYTEVLSLR